MDRRSFLRAAGLVAGGAVVGARGSRRPAQRRPAAAGVPRAPDRTGLTGTGLNAPRVFSRVQTGDQLGGADPRRRSGGDDDGRAEDAARPARVLATFDVVGNRLQQHTELLRQMDRRPARDRQPHLVAPRAGRAARRRHRPRAAQDRRADPEHHRRPAALRPAARGRGDARAADGGLGVRLRRGAVVGAAARAGRGVGDRAPCRPADPVQYVLDNLQPGAIILAHDLGSLSGTGAATRCPG